jgi:hypothetical protein
MPAMEEDGQTYLLPHPPFVRVMLTLAGLFALFIAPYELLRGVWPLNIASPFFGFIMLGGMSVGAVFVYSGLAMPSATLVFHEGSLEVHRKYLHTMRSSLIRAADIDSIDIVESPSSDGPNDWHAVIRAAGHDPIGSRPLSRRAAAEELAEIFRSKLGLKPPAP